MKLAAIAAMLLLLAPTTVSAVVITKLGAGPILTPSDTRAALVDKIRTSERFAIAERDLGLKAAQIRQFNERLPKANYIVLPRHLDKMAYYSNGIKILRDVTIPAETKGWTLDVTGAHIFIPQTCSNISLVFVRGVAAAITHAPLVVVPSPAAIPTPSPTPTVAPAPTLTPAPAATPPVAPVTHHTSAWLGLLLLPLFFIHSGGDTDTTSLSQPIYAPTPTHKPTTPTPLPTPTPVPTNTPCPTPTPTPTKTPCPTPPPCPP